MDDQTFNGILDTMREMNAAPADPEPEIVADAPSDEPMLSEPEVPGEEPVVAEADAEADAPPEDDPTAEWEAIRQRYEQEAQQARQAAAEARAQLEARYWAERDAQQRQAEQEEAAYLLKLHEEDPALANEYQAHRFRIGQQFVMAQVEAEGRTNALHAMHLALQQEVGEQAARKVLQRATDLAALPSVQAMQQTVQAARQAQQSDNAKIVELEQAVKALTAKLAASQRDPRADRVETPVAGGGAKPRSVAEATSLDELFAVPGWNPFAGAAD